MRNGLNISGVSEIVHEIRENGAEAVIRFSTSTAVAGDRAEVTVGTAHHGTFRMARDFRLALTGAEAADPGLTPVEAAAAAIGACVLITHVHGYSARGISLTSLGVRVTATVPTDAAGRVADPSAGLRDLRYDITVDAEATEAALAQVTQFVTCFSPNHRAFLDAGDYDLSSVLVRPGGTATSRPVPVTAPAATAPAAGELTVVAELQWEYGTEAHVSTAVSPGIEARRAAPTLVVDQSKQMLGIDRGPNPQEMLLTAISAELALGLSALARERGLPLSRIEVDGGGRLDIRGMMNVDPAVPARFHEIRFVVRCEADLDDDPDDDKVAALVTECAANSTLLAVLRRANTADVRLRSPGAEILTLRSDAAQVSAFIEQIVRQQREQQAAAARAGGDPA
ncbi:hypothetical protein Asp14428_15190 [Actinoplanes sp. NBRC 14428]|uniref:OsmC-like protein n=1 Tax=Pseudosporangium ferrugineum TaxID=439699 RepID=A0A2T0SAR6_9ACTN|nr:OsmC family protein [Pseudosporangium ferrugineum]PRY30508.1 OsmC-like protein [Pseudosporangium ferrugineum]BCJ50044.1 hypothetical protein Asp14428_15190 [Actinoplanes sp. NBRC 14428]